MDYGASIPLDWPVLRIAHLNQPLFYYYHISPGYPATICIFITEFYYPKRNQRRKALKGNVQRKRPPLKCEWCQCAKQMKDISHGASATATDCANHLRCDLCALVARWQYEATILLFKCQDFAPQAEETRTKWTFLEFVNVQLRWCYISTSTRLVPTVEIVRVKCWNVLFYNFHLHYVKTLSSFLSIIPLFVHFGEHGVEHNTTDRVVYAFGFG